MFFKLILPKIVYASPSDLGPLLRRQLEYLLRDAVEGKTIDDVGLIVGVIDICNPRQLEGKVLDSGFVSFELQYEAIVFKAFPHEVIDARVVEVRAEGVLADAGAISVYISKLNIPSDYVFESDGAIAKMVKRDGTRSINVGDVLRVRITAETKSKDFQAVGTIDGHFLGPR